MSKIDSGRVKKFLAPGDEPGADSHTKGQALEGAIRYAFEQIPGVSCLMQDQRNSFETEEIDLLFSNLAHEDGLVRFESELIVEAKNWKSNVGAIEINWLASKMRRRNRRTGVLVAAKGITGDKERLTAARFEVATALNEGQEVILLTRGEIEAVSTGQRLAELLVKKKDHLVGRADIYIADVSELRHTKRGFRSGFEAFADILKGEHTKRIEEAAALRVAIPEGDAGKAEMLRDKIQEAERSMRQTRSDPEHDPMGRETRESLMQALGICVSWLDALGYSNVEAIRINSSNSGAGQLSASVGSRLWDALMGYYLDELQDHPASWKEPILHGMVAMLVEEVWKIDDYVPEPDDF